MKEEWKDIEDFEGYYQVSNKGRVRSLDRVITCSRGLMFNKKGKLLSMNKFSTSGYRICCLSKGKIRKNMFIHRLVAISFISNPNKKPEVNHKDGDKLNNNDWNLEWSTPFENSNHSVETGLYPLGVRHHNNKLSEIEVLNVYKLAHESIMSQNMIAKKFNITQSTVSNIKNGIIWAKITKHSRNKKRGKYAT